MNAPKKEKTDTAQPLPSSDEKTVEVKQKTCFAIMPIADHPDYTSGHFTRVYEHLIKPACELAGYKIIRADDAKASHMIMFDILKNIVECDMAICDLSSKNANVFYELGLRQAFNKKTILITDSITNTPFDITGFRYVKYSESLRVDTVMNDVLEVSAMLKETDEADEDDINSIVNLLKIQPATINKVELNDQESVLYDLIRNLDAKVSRLSSASDSRKNLYSNIKSTNWEQFLSKSVTGLTFEQAYKRSDINSLHFREGNTVLGRFIGINEENELVFSNGDEQYVCPNNDFYRVRIQVL
ncbi:hypothetical protein [Citrobacter braakii]|uniref:hypothetical protein n=1 Tax=Citrobacter braakii TaxID=57706 RepID=UPI003974F73D